MLQRKKLSDSIWLTKSNESKQTWKNDYLIRWRSRMSTSANIVYDLAMVVVCVFFSLDLMHSFHKLDVSVFFLFLQLFFHTSFNHRVFVWLCIIVYAFLRGLCAVRIECYNMFAKIRFQWLQSQLSRFDTIYVYIFFALWSFFFSPWLKILDASLFVFSFVSLHSNMVSPLFLLFLRFSSNINRYVRLELNLFKM